MEQSMLDVLMIQETKLDDSFPNNQFSIANFKSYRKDFTAKSGGLVMYIRSDLPQRRVKELENSEVESGRVEVLANEIVISDEKWLICSVYKQPTVKDADISNLLESLFNKCSKDYSNYIVCGDINVNVLNEKHCLKDIFNVYGVTNIVNEPTCFKSIDNPSLIDLVITNVPKRIKTAISIDTGLSDFHNMICFSTKLHVKQRKKKIINYRSYKHFEEGSYLKDLSEIPFHVAEVFDSMDDAYWFCDKLVKSVINLHAPLKQRIVSHKQVPYMNSELRKSINVRNMLRRKYDNNKSKENWQKYIKHRNLVTKIRKKSKNQYIKEKCNASKTGRDFWNTVKPMMSNKTSGSDVDIAIIENGNIINNPREVGNVLNEYYVNVTRNIGQPNEINAGETISDIVNSHKADECVINISDQIGATTDFSFREVLERDVCKKLKNLNPKKATGHDNIPPKLVKIGASILCKPITYLVNMSIKTSVFPDTLKRAEVTPIYKKEDMLDKKNYRPVSVLPCISKVYESILLDQLGQYFEPLLSPHLSGFRKAHSCQNVLVRFVEKTKMALDKGSFCGAILTDLSKAFDCLPYRLLISKLKAYGVSEQACLLIANYFCGRQQRVKIGSIKSEWRELIKGAPQGSLFGPFMFNIFQNDLLCSIEKKCDIFNYADDNTICCYGNSINEVSTKLQSAIDDVLKWFDNNYMQANPAKFQLIMFGKGEPKCTIRINNQVSIQSEENVKLLGVVIDNKLTFNNQITCICKRQAGKLMH